MNRRAVVTGASAGLGFAVAAALAGAGHHVTIVARRPDKLAQARSNLLRQSPQATIETASVDLADAHAVDALVGGQARHRLGPPDVFVHVAGGPPLYEPGTESEHDLRVHLQAHSLSLATALRTFAPLMQDRGFGRVIAVMSRALAEPRADNPLSAAVRLPAWALLKSYSRSRRFSSVTFNAVLPGLFDTERFAEVCVALARRNNESVEQARERFLSAVPAGRLGRPAELGAFCAFLVSEAGSYINGQRIVMDGGSTGAL